MFDASELHIVIVIDGDGPAALVRNGLRTAGVRNITLARTPQDVADTMSLKRPDALFTLVRDAVPNDRGLALIRAIRSSKGANRYLPIIVVSPKPTRAVVTATINAGGHEFIGIPFSGESLWRKMASAVCVGWPFIETENYFGPCRRRYISPAYNGPERRAELSSEAKAERVELERRRAAVMSGTANTRRIESA